jgi:hypothetical protein
VFEGILISIYLVVAKVRERLSVSKQSRQKFHMERFDLEKEIKADVISNRFAAFENLRDNWGSAERNIQILSTQSVSVSTESARGTYEERRGAYGGLEGTPDVKEPTWKTQA